MTNSFIDVIKPPAIKPLIKKKKDNWMNHQNTFNSNRKRRKQIKQTKTNKQKTLFQGKQYDPESNYFYSFSYAKSKYLKNKNLLNKEVERINKENSRHQK